MSDKSIMLTGAPYHVLSYGTLLGTTFFHSFINGIVMYKTVPRAQFSALQTNIFPIYFALQTATPVILALTYPARISPHTGTAIGPSGVAGVLGPLNRTSVFWPLATMFVTSLINMVYLRSATVSCMNERKKQESKDGKKCIDTPPHSDEMNALNKRFSWLHGSSTVLNLIGFIATVVYGVNLSARLT